MKQRLDIYERFPAGMEEYLSNYGWHFSKKMVEFAISQMKDRSGSPIRIKDKETLHEAMKGHGVDTKNIVGYDAVYVEAMARADYYGSSISSEQQLSMFIGDYINDPDGYDGIALTRFYADCIAKGVPIYWEEML